MSDETGKLTQRRDGRPRLSEVAERSGVSTAAVSYVLNNRADKSISTSTRARVLAAAEDLGYVPNAAAAALRRGHNKVVLLVTDATLAGETGARIVDAMVAGVTQQGYTALAYTKVSDGHLCEVVAAAQPMAVMLATFVSQATRARLTSLGVRHVFGLGSKPEGAEDGDRFWERVIGEAQVRHLVELGHTRIGFILPPPTSSRHLTARARLAGAVAECARYGLDAPVAVSVGLDRSAVAQELSMLRSDGVSAVCAHDNRTAVAILASMQDLTWRAPVDMAVVGVGDTWHARLTTPLLSVVVMRGVQLAPQSADWIAAAVRGELTDVTDSLRLLLPPVESSRRGTT